MIKIVLEYVILQRKAIPNNPIIKLNKKYRNSNSIVFFMSTSYSGFKFCITFIYYNWFGVNLNPLFGFAKSYDTKPNFH